MLDISSSSFCISIHLTDALLDDAMLIIWKGRGYLIFSVPALLLLSTCFLPFENKDLIFGAGCIYWSLDVWRIGTKYNKAPKTSSLIYIHKALYKDLQTNGFSVDHYLAHFGSF